jgi:RNA ligase (TIGR02306 family)
MTKLASIERIKSIAAHPNADRLELAHVLGYICVVPKDKYSEGDLVVLIQPDTVLPDKDWAEFYKKLSKSRVKAAKIRGVWSYGIIESLNIIPWAHPDNMFEGHEVSKDIGVTKYEAPQPTELNAKGAIPYSIPKTYEERWQNVDIDSLLGQSVDVTLKVDGRSFTAIYKDGYFGVCGRTMEYKPECHNNYTAHVKRYNLAEELANYCEKHQVNIALRGESYGKGIQSSNNNPHSKLNNGLFFFSVYLIDEHRYTSPNELHSVANVCSKLDLPLVPVVEKSVPLTYDLIKKYDEEQNLIDGLPFEGVVIAGNGFSFKVINKHYDSKK